MINFYKLEFYIKGYCLVITKKKNLIINYILDSIDVICKWIYNAYCNKKITTKYTD
jgi:hypothetical protein